LPLYCVHSSFGPRSFGSGVFLAAQREIKQRRKTGSPTSVGLFCAEGFTAKPAVLEQLQQFCQAPRVV
jgi:hypothetical protein